MTEFAGLVAAILVAIAVACIAVGLARERLRWFAVTRTRRSAVGVSLFVLEAVVGVLLSSIDFGASIRDRVFTRQDWPLVPWVVVLVGVGAGIQLMVLLHDDFAETERAAHEREAQLARKDRAFILNLSNMINRAVSRKREKLAQVSDASALLAALDPKHAIAALIQYFWHVFDGMGPEKRETNFRLRVAYYRCTGQRLVLAHSWNGSEENCVPMSDDVRRRFRFDHLEGCLAVAASKSGAIYRVADTLEAHDDRQHPFWFFEQSERDTLKSIAALPIKLDGTKAPYSVLIVDTNVKNFFNTDQRQGLELEQVVKNLAQRLLLEERLESLVGEPS